MVYVSADCVLQWRVGCEAEMLANDTLIFGKQVEEYHLNGEFTQSTNGRSLRGAAPVQHTPPFEEMLKGAKNINDYFSDFPLNECVDQMRKFLIYNDREPC